MSEWLVALEGTPEGARVAMAMALFSAFMHACFGALQKGRHDPWVTRGAIDVFNALYAAPFAFFVVPWPRGGEWLILLGAVGLHFAYKLTMALAYERAAYTVVYPVVRGTGPLATLSFAALFLSEHYVAVQWLGVGLLSAAILAIAAVNLRGRPVNGAALRLALAWAVLAGALSACYTTYDAWGIRSVPDPFTFLAWFFLVTSLDFPLLMGWRLARGAVPMPPAPGRLMARGALGAAIALLSFGGVMLATRIGKVGEVAALREVSTIFAAGIGWAVLGERVGPLRAVLMALVAAGAVMVQAG